MIDFAKLNEIEEGLKGVTSGPWHAETCEHPYFDGSKAHIERHVITAYDHPQSKAPVGITRLGIGVGLNGKPPVYMVKMTEPDHLHVARLDPETVRELVKLARIGLDAETRIERLIRERDEALGLLNANEDSHRAAVEATASLQMKADRLAVFYERAQVRNDKLKAALRPFAAMADQADEAAKNPGSITWSDGKKAALKAKDFALYEECVAARAALEDKP
jgi:hypothetical protein